MGGPCHYLLQAGTELPLPIPYHTRGARAASATIKTRQSPFVHFPGVAQQSVPETEGPRYNAAVLYQGHYFQHSTAQWR
jgi:hypothetical protein